MKDYQTDELGAAIPLPGERERGDGRHRRDDEGRAAGHGCSAPGLSVMQSLMDESVTEICGPKGKHRPGREAVRHGTEDGPVILGGRRVPVRRPRGCGLPTAAARSALRRMSCSKFDGTVGRDGDDPHAGQTVHPPLLRRPGTGRRRGRQRGVSHVRSRQVSTSGSSPPPKTALADLLGADLSELDPVALMIEQGSISASISAWWRWGSASTGPSTLWRWSTVRPENATVVTDLLVGLRDRGLVVTLPILVVVDGAKALAAGRSGGVRPSHHRSARQLHKVKKRQSAKLPKGLADTVASKMHAAYRLDSALSRSGRLGGPGPPARSVPSRRPPGSTAEDSKRPSRSCASACRLLWLAHCAQRTRSSP